MMRGFQTVIAGFEMSYCGCSATKKEGKMARVNTRSCVFNKRLASSGVKEYFCNLTNVDVSSNLCW